MAEQAGDSFQISIEPRSARYDIDSDAWQTQVGELAVELQREVGGVGRDMRAIEGAKGGTDTLVLALGSAGVFNAAVTLFRAWLGRDRHRSLVITWTDCGGTHTITIEGDAIEDEAIAEAIEAIRGLIGGLGCPPTTAPS